MADRDRSFALVLLCFVLSGFAALLYQTAWTREFAFVFGTSELAVATVLAAYMGGLSLGSAVAGRVAPSVRRPILVYGLLELGIAVAALAVPSAVSASTALAVALFGGAPELPDARGLALPAFYLAASFAILLVPTALMGATLPLLARHAVRRDEELGPRLAVLYAANTAGAVLGTLAAAFVLLPSLGLRGSVRVGVAANALVFALAWLVARGAAPVSATQPAAAHGETGRRGWILPLVLLSGAASFAYEVLWTRLFGHVLGGSVYAFATMLASFLVGIAAGSALASRSARTPERAARGFALAQIAIAAASLAAFRAVDELPRLASLFGPRAVLDLWPGAAAGVLLLLPSTLAIGATFPLAVRVLARGEADAGPASARVFAWNTLGAIGGALGAGFFAIPALGYAWSLTALVALGLALAAAAATLLEPRAPRLAAVSLALLAGLVLAPPRAPERLLRSSPLRLEPIEGEIAFFAVGRSASVLLVESDGSWKLRTNGLPEAEILPPGRLSSDAVNAWLAALPSLLRPGTRSLLAVGLGGGTVLEGVPRSVASVDAIELEPQVVAANRHVAALRARDPLADPRVRVRLNDARGALLLTARRWDAIVSQPSHPWTAGASHLYTREFFELARDHLEPGGVFVQWIGLAFVDADLLRSLVATLASAFPHVRVYQPRSLPALLFAASQRPFPSDAELAAGRGADPEAWSALGLHDPEDLAAALRLEGEGAARFAAGAPVSRDDRNVLQMRAPQVLRASLRMDDLDPLFAPFDPLAAPRGLDTALLVRRLSEQREYARARRVAAAAPDPALRRLGEALVEAARDGAAAERALRAILAEGPPAALADEARAALVLLTHRLHGAAAAVEAARGLAAPARAVARGWLEAERDAWRAVSALDGELARVPPRHTLHPEALRLRIGWRLDSRDRNARRSALALADELVVLRLGLADRVLRARAAAASGLVSAALGDLEELGAGVGPPGARRVLEALDEIPADPALAERRGKLSKRLRAAAARAH